MRSGASASRFGERTFRALLPTGRLTTRVTLTVSLAVGCSILLILNPSLMADFIPKKVAFLPRDLPTGLCFGVVGKAEPLLS